MADGNKNIFKRVRKELKKVIWPTKEQWKKTSAVVLVVILFFAMYLGIVSKGAEMLLTKVHFYDQVDSTTETSVAVPEEESDISYDDSGDLETEEVGDSEMIEGTESDIDSLSSVVSEETTESSETSTVSSDLDGNVQ